MRKEKTQARTLPPLKRAMDEKIRKELAARKEEKKENEGETREEKVETKAGVDDDNDKDFAEAKKIDKAKLHEIMDQEFNKLEEKLNDFSKEENLDKYWKTVSRAIENAWIKHLEYDKEIAKKSKGRGEVKITTAIPKIRINEVEEDKIRNPLMYKANENLKQARRCEQICHRMFLRKNAEEEKRPSMTNATSVELKESKNAWT